MVEMLGVLAIVGVLSVGGVYGYGVAMKKHKANELLHQASMLATTISAQIQSKGELPQSIENFGDAKYGTFKKPEKANDEQFTMQITGMDEAVCEQVAKMSGGMVRQAKCNTTTLTLTYNNNLSSDKVAADYNGKQDECEDSGRKYCDNDTCIPATEECPTVETIDPACADVTCEDGLTCVNGECVDSACFDVTCDTGLACVQGECVDSACLDVTCEDGLTCVNGECVDSACLDVTCDTGLTCVQGECVDSACLDVECPEGSTCSRGQCQCSNGLFVCGTQCCAEGTYCTGPDTGVSSYTCAKPTSGCTKNSDCKDAEGNVDTTKYCWFSDDSCTNLGTGTCTDKGTLTPYTLNLPGGALTVYKGGVMNWWSAVNFCEAHDKKQLVTMSDLGIADSGTNTFCYFYKGQSSYATKPCICNGGSDSDCSATNAAIRTNTGALGTSAYLWLADNSKSSSCYARGVILGSGYVNVIGRPTSGYSALCR